MLSVFPKAKDDLDGIINAYSSQLKITINSSSDANYVHCPFYRNCGTDISWAAYAQNDWLEIDFGDDLLFLTHYSITGLNRTYRVKGWYIQAKDKNGVTHRIDTVNNALPNKDDIEVRKIKKHGPFSSFRFVITDTHMSTEQWYCIIYGIDFFGIVNPSDFFLKGVRHESCKRQMKKSLSLMSFIIISMLMK